MKHKWYGNDKLEGQTEMEAESTSLSTLIRSRIKLSFVFNSLTESHFSDQVWNPSGLPLVG